MKKFQKFIIAVVFISITISTSVFTKEAKTQIEVVNTKVKSIEKAIKEGKYPKLRFENIIEAFETIPPVFHFFYTYDTHKLVAVTVDVGHETWGISYYYFFDEEERIIKYLKVVTDRPDNPPEIVIIYNTDSSVLWSNTDHLPRVAPADIRGFYKKAFLFQLEFSGY